MNIGLPQSDLLNTVTVSGTAPLSSNQETLCVNLGSGKIALVSNIVAPFYYQEAISAKPASLREFVSRTMPNCYNPN